MSEDIKRYDINVADEVFEQLNGGDWVKYSDHKAVVETMQKELDIYKPSLGIQEFVELDCLSTQTPKQINGIFHKLHDETLVLQNKIEELEKEKEEILSLNLDLNNKLVKQVLSNNKLKKQVAKGIK